MSLQGFIKGLESQCFPRVSGDEPAEIGWAAAVIRFSPREWG